MSRPRFSQSATRVGLRGFAQCVSRMALCAVLGAAFVATWATPQQAKAEEATTSKDATKSSKEQPAKKRVAVGKLSGPKPDSARDALLEGLEESEDVRVVGQDEVLPADSSAEQIAEYAQKVGADAVLVGKTSQKAGVWQANIEVRNGKDGSLLDSFQVSGRQKKYMSELQNSERFLPAIAQGELEPVLVASSKREDSGEEAAAPSAAVGGAVQGEVGEKPAEAREGRPSPLDLRAGMRLYSRSFRYTDTLADVFTDGTYARPLTYNVAAAPMAFIHGDWFPLAHFMGGWPAHIGVTGGYELGFATNVAYGNRLLDQTHWMWFAGPKIRIPFSTHWMGLFATLGTHNYAIEGDDTISSVDNAEDTTDAQFPDVKYKFIDLGADVHLRFDELRIGAHAQYRLVTSSGEIESDAWFPSTSTKGISFGGEVGWKLTEMFDLMLGLDVLQYGLNFNPVSTNTPKSQVAGGATDRYLSVWAALQFVLPGQEAVVAGTGPGETPTKPQQVPGGKEDFDSFDDF